MIEPKIGVYTHNYSPEVSPVVKGLLSYLALNKVDVNLIVNSLGIDSNFKLQDVPIIELIPSEFHFRKPIMGESSNKVLRKIRKSANTLIDQSIDILNKRKLRAIITGYDLVIAIEWYALIELYEVGYPISKIIYFSLEAEDNFGRCDKNLVIRLLSQCAFCIIQSKEREEGLKNFLGIDIEFEHLPVSMRPIDVSLIKQEKDIGNNSDIRIIYSGYFAEWACITEFIDGYTALSMKVPLSLAIHGHYLGTEQYLERIRSSQAKAKNLSISTDYLNDDAHIKYLSQFNIGLAFYKSISGTSNWENLLFSSGKIASYLWAGLAVMTNIKTPRTLVPPFLYLNDFSGFEIKNQLEKYLSQADKFHQSALEFAFEFYNLDKYMDTIIRRLQGAL